MNLANRVAVALALEDTESVLDTLNELRTSIGLAEVRLDLMHRFDLEKLITHAPCPLIITCRPPREGGRFRGSETERLEILTRASALGCAYVDIEWDCVDKFDNPGSSTRVIVSRHYYNGMPLDLLHQYARMRTQADVVKLVGFAARASESIAMLRMAADADTPVIAIAMGNAGEITRLLTPCFDACLLTYAAVESGQATAPGQIGVRDMVDKYAIDRVSRDTQIEVYVYTLEEDESRVLGMCGGDGGHLRLALRVESDELDFVAAALPQLSGRIRVVPPGLL